jgi:hypothetical protein
MLLMLILLLAIFPTLVFVYLEAHVTDLVAGQLRLYNAVDLFVMSVFYHVIFHLFKYEVFERHARSKNSEGDFNPRTYTKSTRFLADVSSALYTVFQVLTKAHSVHRSTLQKATHCSEYIA